MYLIIMSISTDLPYWWKAWTPFITLIKWVAATTEWLEGPVSNHLLGVVVLQWSVCWPCQRVVGLILCASNLSEGTESKQGCHNFNFKILWLFAIFHTDLSILPAPLQRLFPHILIHLLVQLYQRKLMWFLYLWRVKRICVFKHSVMTNFNCACPAIQESGFLSEGSSWLTTCMSEQRRFWRDCADAFAARIGDKYQLRLTRPILFLFFFWYLKEGVKHLINL